MYLASGELAERDRGAGQSSETWSDPRWTTSGCPDRRWIDPPLLIDPGRPNKGRPSSGATSSQKDCRRLVMVASAVGGVPRVIRPLTRTEFVVTLIITYRLHLHIVVDHDATEAGLAEGACSVEQCRIVLNQCHPDGVILLVPGVFQLQSDRPRGASLVHACVHLRVSSGLGFRGRETRRVRLAGRRSGAGDCAHPPSLSLSLCSMMPWWSGPAVPGCVRPSGCRRQG